MQPGCQRFININCILIVCVSLCVCVCVCVQPKLCMLIKVNVANREYIVSCPCPPTHSTRKGLGNCEHPVCLCLGIARQPLDCI